MAGCMLCSENDHSDHRRVYSTCDIMDGQRCDACTEYLEIEAQIERTRQTLQDQLRRRCKQREKINRMHDPMNRVPREIKMFIFELATSVATKESSTFLEGQLYAPLPLGRVCGAWRDVAWGMPQLWNFIFACFHNKDRFPLHLDIATQWLKRSGDYLPLSIHFTIDPTTEDETLFIPFIDLLNTYSHRWKDLCGFAPPKLFSCLSAKLGGAQTLTNLRISSHPDERVDFDLGCDELPQLRRVQLNVSGGPQFNIALDWTQVTILVTNCLFPFVLLNLIPNLPELTELRVYDLPRGGDIDLDHPSFFHPKLRRLHLVCSIATAVQEICHLLAHLDLGSVEDITLDFMESIAIFNAFVGSIRQSQCAHRGLRSLTLWDPSWSSGVAFGELLECAESLEELEFCITNELEGNAGILEALLTPIQGHANAVQRSTLYLSFSKLQRIKYHMRYPEGVPWSFLLPIFEGSIQADNYPPLKSLSVFCGLPSRSTNYGLDEEMIQRLIGLVDAGIELFLFEKTMSRDDLVNLVQNSTTR